MYTQFCLHHLTLRKESMCTHSISLIFATTSAGYSCGVALLSLYQCCISDLLVEFFDLIVLLCYSFGLRLPHIAYISAASVISVCRFYTNV